jgi:hypothetical protein
MHNSHVIFFSKGKYCLKLKHFYLELPFNVDILVYFLTATNDPYSSARGKCCHKPSPVTTTLGPFVFHLSLNVEDTGYTLFNSSSCNHPVFPSVELPNIFHLLTCEMLKLRDVAGTITYN